jgi:predicted nucleic acid-binding protein
MGARIVVDTNILVSALGWLLECAVEGGAEAIVSGDTHLLNLARFGEIPLLTVGDFLQRYGEGG